MQSGISGVRLLFVLKLKLKLVKLCLVIPSGIPAGGCDGIP